MSQYVVAVTDHVFADLEPERKTLAALDVDFRTAQAKTPEEVREVVRGADAILTCYAPIPSEVIGELKSCKIITRYGIGVDNVDIAAARAKGILVTNVPDYCIDEVSDHALILLLALARKIVTADRNVRAGHWQLQALRPIRRLRGQTLGLVAFGQIARALTSKAQALGMRVIATDPYVSETEATALNVELVEFDTLLKESDFVSIHAPLTEDTRNMFGGKTFEKMKPSAFLINTARGALVDEVALVDAISRGKLAGGALDVLSEEPPPEDSPLFSSQNLILTPHSAFYSEESLRELQRRAAEEIARALRGEPPRSPVNATSLRDSPP